MTIQSNQGFGVTIFGATSSSGGGGGGTPGGSNGQVQYNSSGSFAGAAGLITDGASLTVTSGSFGLSGNISAPAWTTAGIRYKNVAATITDTSSTGTVAAAYTDLFGGNTIAASNATTFTDYYTMFVSAATAGSNVTMTNKWALGLAGNLKLGPDASGTNQAGTNVTIGGSRGTGTGAGGSIVFQVAPAGSSGTAQNALATAWSISGAGHFLAGDDNTYDIGASGATRPRNIYPAGKVELDRINSEVNAPYLGIRRNSSGGLIRCYLSADAAVDGNLVLTNSGLTDFGRLQFGGTTSSFPALKRNSTALETKLADDSAYAPHAMQYLDVTDGITAPASATGRARIYVDTADGDLKVIFADGTVKTIVTDT